jgi:hypothetical protein
VHDAHIRVLRVHTLVAQITNTVAGSTALSCIRIVACAGGT